MSSMVKPYSLIARLWNRLGRGKSSVAAPAAAQPEAAAAPLPPPAPRARAAKQAVILVHGMGEQIPMDTIKGFVRTTWELDGSIAGSRLADPTKVWSRPDPRTGSLELRRITTRESVPRPAFPKGVRTDFYELYWADLTAGSTWRQFVAWVRYLLLRRWSRVPRDVRGAWLLLWAASLIVVGFALIGFVPKEVWTGFAPRWLSQSAVIALVAAAGSGLHVAATRSFGRVVRYTRADPDNIAARAAVRKRGLELLRALHADDAYARVILVGHSLGSILAYDLVSYFWAEQVEARTVERGTEAFDALCALEAAAAALDAGGGEAARADYARAQRALRLALARRGREGPPPRRWLISDLVTLGSPLTHAEFLLARDEADLRQRIESRELPTAPPYREPLDPLFARAARATGALPIEPPDAPRLISFPERSGRRWTLHHAAPFAAVRWTNLHDPARLVLLGDLIGGPLAPAFGPAVTDVDLSALDGRSWRFSHTRYWHPEASPVRLAALRAALNLTDEES